MHGNNIREAKKAPIWNTAAFTGTITGQSAQRQNNHGLGNINWTKSALQQLQLNTGSASAVSKAISALFLLPQSE